MIYNRIDSFLEDNGIDLSGKRIIAGFSGGPDSTLLMLYLLYASENSGVQFKAVHLNHMERDDADEEENFVKSFCEVRGIKCSFYKEDIYAHEDIKDKGFEMCARERRRSFLEREADAFSADYIMTGHNCDDRIETFFLNASRGSGLRGLSSMRAVNGKYIKPLLFLEKGDIESYLRGEGIEFIVDSTNSKEQFRRNRLRRFLSENETTLFEHGKTSFLRTIDMLEESDYLFSFMADRYKKEIFRREKGGWVLDISNIINYNNILFKGIINYCLKDLYNADEAFVSEIVKMLRSPKGSLSISRGGYVFRKEYEKLFINETAPRGREELNISPITIECGERVSFGGYTLKAERGVFRMNGCEESFCAAFSIEAGTKFHVRSRQDGDRFMPFGHSSEMKLKDYLIEMKVPLFRRNLLPLVIDASGRIIYIAGLKRSGLYRAVENKECIYIYAEKDS